MELKNNMIMKNETKIYIDDVLHYLDVDKAKSFHCIRPVIKIGQRYRLKDSAEYILATHTASKAMLINLNTGGRWNDGAHIGKYDDITKIEFDEICESGDFTLVK